MSDFGLYRLTDDGALHPGFNQGAPSALASPANVSNAGPTALVRGAGRIYVVGIAETPEGDRLMLHSAPVHEGGGIQLLLVAGLIDIADFFVGTGFETRSIGNPSLVADRFGHLVLAAAVDVGAGTRASLLRLNPGVGVDRSFAGLSHDWNAGGGVVVSSIARDAAGSFVVAGGVIEGGQLRPALARYDWRGRLDGSFGAGGILVVDELERAWFTSVALDRLGRIVAAGESKRTSSTEAVVFRCSAHGVADTSFGTDGTVLHPAGTAQAIGLTSRGSIVVGGVNVRPGVDEPDLGYVLRLTEAGDMDTTFGSGGLVMGEDPPSGWIAVPRGAAVPAEFGRLARVFDLFVDYQDRIVVAGSAAGTSNLGRAAAARILPDGQPDTGFAGTGLVLLAPNDQVDESPFATAMTADPTGGYWVTAAFQA